jgi:hypothetical protein
MNLRVALLAEAVADFAECFFARVVVSPESAVSIGFQLWAKIECVPVPDSEFDWFEVGNGGRCSTGYLPDECKIGVVALLDSVRSNFSISVRTQNTRDILYFCIFQTAC